MNVWVWLDKDKVMFDDVTNITVNHTNHHLRIETMVGGAVFQKWDYYEWGQKSGT